MAGTPELPHMPGIPGVPNLQAVVDNTATFYFNQGVLGGTIILLLLLLVASWAVIWILYRALRRQDSDIRTLLRESLTYISGAQAAEAETKEALRGVENSLNLRPELLSNISHQLELLTSEQRHAFANLSQMGRGLVSVIRDVRSVLKLKREEAS